MTAARQFKDALKDLGFEGVIVPSVSTDMRPRLVVAPGVTVFPGQHGRDDEGREDRAMNAHAAYSAAAYGVRL